jgi:hypothetical protein
MSFRGASIFSLLFCVCVACKQELPTKLYGHWRLDSISVKNGKIIEAGLPESEFTLLPSKHFIFKWSDFDVFGEYQGTYSYEKNGKENELIFLINHWEKKDSIIEKRIITVISLNDSLLTTREKDKHVSFDSIVTFHNRIRIYRKR